MSAYDFLAIFGSHLVWLIVTLEQLLGGSAFSNCPTRRTSSCFVEHPIPDEDGRFRRDTQERTSVDYKLQGWQWLLKKKCVALFLWTGWAAWGQWKIKGHGGHHTGNYICCQKEAKTTKTCILGASRVNTCHVYVVSATAQQCTGSSFGLN